MSLKYFNSHEVPFIFDPDCYKIFMLIGDQWVEIVDADIRNRVRFDSTEITMREAQELIKKTGRSKF